MPSTKQRLAAIVQGFDDFDAEMKTGTRVSDSVPMCNLCNSFSSQQRREKDEFKIAELKMEIRRLDQELTVEIKRRTEMNKSTQAVNILSYVHHKLGMTVCIYSGLRNTWTQ